MNKRFLCRGFTMVELLVVISIMGILSALIYASFSDARILAKNKVMRSEIKETQLALEVYKAQNGNYPAALSDLRPEFIPDVPDASKSANPAACSIDYAEWGNRFKLTATRCIGGAASAAEGVQPDDEFARCPSTCGTCAGSAYNPSLNTFYESIAIYSSGGECE